MAEGKIKSGGSASKDNVSRDSGKASPANTVGGGESLKTTRAVAGSTCGANRNSVPTAAVKVKSGTDSAAIKSFLLNRDDPWTSEKLR